MDVVRVRVEGEENIELELCIDELVDVALGTNSMQDFDLNVDLDLVDVDDGYSIVNRA